MVNWIRIVLTVLKRSIFGSTLDCTIRCTFGCIFGCEVKVDRITTLQRPKVKKAAPAPALLQCSHCDRKLKNKHLLAEHERRHTGEKVEEEAIASNIGRQPACTIGAISGSGGHFYPFIWQHANFWNGASLKSTNESGFVNGGFLVVNFGSGGNFENLKDTYCL